MLVQDAVALHPIRKQVYTSHYTFTLDIVYDIQYHVTIGDKWKMKN